jgi:hypothetical protein
MVRFLLNTALALYLSVLPATAADRYGGWLIEQPRSSVRTFSFKQSVHLNNKILTSELGASFVIKGKAQRVSAQYSYLLMERSKMIGMWFPF